jgi:hypothetical protein
MPADKAIPVKAIPPPRNGATREFIRDKELLQREQKKGVATALTLGAYIGVFLIWLAMIAVVAWGLGRLGRSLGATPGGGRRTQAERSPARPRPAESATAAS